MPAVLEQLGIDGWSVEDRLSLAQEIWDSVAHDIDHQPLSDVQRLELLRRIEHANAQPESGVPWETVKAEALARSRR